MQANTSSDSAENNLKEAHVRAKILHDHLQELARTTANENLNLVLAAAAAGLWMKLPESLPDDATDGPEEVIERVLPGGLAEGDLKRYQPSLTNLDRETQKLLADELERTLLDITEFYWGEVDDLRERALRLPDDLIAHLNRLSDEKSELETARGHIENLVKEINMIHPRLHQQLIDVLGRFSAPVQRKHMATYDLHASTIETSLLKLSLIRARAHASLYGLQSPKHPEATMIRALTEAHKKFTEEERQLEEEEEALDKQLEEYQQLLELVDGSSRDGGFAQVVEDWVRVQKETDECRRDLRRLGWTGD